MRERAKICWSSSVADAASLIRTSSPKKKVPDWLKKFEQGLSGDPPDSHNVAEGQLVVEPKEKTLDDMMVSSDEESVDLAFFLRKGPRDPTRASHLAGTKFLHMFLKIRIVKSVSSQRLLSELRAGAARKHEETAFIIHENVAMRFWRVIKFSIRRTNLVCRIFTQSWWQDLLKLRKNDKQFAKVLAARSRPGIFHTDNSLVIIHDHDKSTPYRSETNGIAETTVRRVKEGTFALLVQSEKKWSEEAMECFCYLRNFQEELGMEQDLASTSPLPPSY